MRLRLRNKVDLPHPEGPMMAVISPSCAEKETSRSARNDPYDTRRLRVSTAGSVAWVIGARPGRPALRVGLPSACDEPTLKPLTISTDPPGDICLRRRLDGRPEYLRGGPELDEASRLSHPFDGHEPGEVGHAR